MVAGATAEDRLQLELRQLEFPCVASTDERQKVQPTSLTFEEALSWLSEPVNEKRAASTEWELGVLTCYVESNDIALWGASIQRLQTALGFATFEQPMSWNSVVFDACAEALGQSQGLFQSVVQAYIICYHGGALWTWSPKHKRTQVLLYGAEEEGTRFIEYMWMRISEGAVVHPLLVGAAVLEWEVIEEKRTVRGRAFNLQDLQIETGFHDYDPPAFSRREDRHSGGGSDQLARMSREACSHTMRVATVSLVLGRLLKFADLLLDECATLKTLTQAAAEEASPEADAKLIEDLQAAHLPLEAGLKMWRRRCDEALDEANACKYKAGIIVQTVFTLATQRDTAVSIEIAKDSRTLAQQATRDSTSMKAIAAVTMCFLPGTFVASLFAMPMFEWPHVPGRIISNNFWIYWAITIPLTAVVIIIWLAWTNRSDLRELVMKARARSKRV